MFTEVGGDVVAFGVEIGAYRHLPRPIVLTDALHAPDLSAKMNADTLPNRPILSFTMKLMKDENTVRTNSQRYLYKARTERYLSLIIQAQASRLVSYITKRDTRHTARADKAHYHRVEVPPTRLRNGGRHRPQIRSKHRIRYAPATSRKPLESQ